ncbi:MAG: tRNA pseudouridine(55) synthase TruB [Acidimicrobiales bacterium]
MDALVVVDKPVGWTSHDVVARCRRIFSQRKAGHAGTLDPDATGVLLVGLGQVTRLLQFLSGLPKRYVGEVVLGAATSTLDASGELTAMWDMAGVGLAAARAAAARLTGDILQIPPMVSAVKVGGKRLYELARAGTEVDRAPRPVRVTRFDVSMAADQSVEHVGAGPVLAIDVECSSGTYVRELAAQLGASLGGGGYLRRLRRLAVGAFSVEEAVTLDELASTAKWPASLLTPAAALRGMPVARVGPSMAAEVSHGKVFSLQQLRDVGATGPGPWAVVSKEGDLLAVYKEHGSGLAKPVVVMVPGDVARALEPGRG